MEDGRKVKGDHRFKIKDASSKLINLWSDPVMLILMLVHVIISKSVSLFIQMENRPMKY
ncbi:hypothetical protein BofuT4_P098770.1 [Botrytis cinerea T4]|uniref:Uncharacterized protein n=1 Tax=Botryotinia fuckeliana (strain T4) TaxID=999810 RepID=G2YCI9_BOTF4|nr:hypothetical protein BofuT4_P098770.1 [Botrytis cinerea T4]